MVEVAPTPDAPRAGYIYQVDLLRLFAASAVMVFHLSWRVPGWSGVAPFGWVGVQIFFVISGLVIANSVEGATGVSFTRSRVLRLYPVAWGCAIISLAAVLAFSNVGRSIGIEATVSPWSVLGSLALIKGPFIESAYWTLPIEIAFYALVGLCIFRRIAIRPLWLGGGLIAWSGLYFLASSAHWAGLAGAPDLDLGYSILNISLLRYGAYFGIGVLLAECGRRGFSLMAFALLLLGAAIGAVEIGWRAHSLAGRYAAIMDWRRLAVTAFGIWILSVALIGWSVRARRGLPERFAATARLAGLVTYPLYLLHQAVGGNVEGWLVTHGQPFWLAFAAGVTASLLAALVVVLAWEPWTRRRLALVFDAVADLISRRGRPAPPLTVED